MTNILVYDVEAKKIEELAKRYDYTVADVIESLLELLESDKVDADEWFTGE